MKYQVGIIGLGVLGSAIAAVLLKSGFSVLGFDTDPTAMTALEQQGIGQGESARNISENSVAVITCLPSTEALDRVVSGAEGLLNSERRNGVVIETSTLPIDDKIIARKSLSEVGISLMDCPVSGNRVMALAGELTAFASGTVEDFETVKSLLNGFCRKAHFVGEFGNGMKMKICGNILNLVHNSVAAEVMTLGMKSGLDAKMIHRVISGSGSSSRMFEVRGGMMADNDYRKEGMNFSVPIKDARIISEHAAKLRCPTPIYQAALQPYYAAIAQGYADLDASAVLKVMANAVNLKRPPEDA